MQVDLQASLEELARDLFGTATAAGGVREIAGLSAGQIDELPCRGYWSRRRRHEQHGRRLKQRDWDEVSLGMKWTGGVRELMHHQRSNQAEQQCVPIGRRLCGQCRAVIAAVARNIVDDDRLAQSRS
jgi:hypothetical protein